jgi:hypothetical protein
MQFLGNRTKSILTDIAEKNTSESQNAKLLAVLILMGQVDTEEIRNDMFDSHFKIEKIAAFTDNNGTQIPFRNAISYLPQGKDDPGNEYSSNKRVTVKIGKGLRKFFSMFKIDLTDRELEIITNDIKSATMPPEFMVVSGSDITTLYHEQRNERVGTLGGSCMRHSSCQDYIDIYANADVSLLVSYTGRLNPDDNLPEKISGRALIWHNVVNLDFDMMDRVYGDESTISNFKDYAAENNLCRLKNQTYGEYAAVYPSGEEFCLKNKAVMVDFGEVRTYDCPYVDTFCWLDEENGEALGAVSWGVFEKAYGAFRTYQYNDTDGDYNDFFAKDDFGAESYDSDSSFITLPDGRRSLAMYETILTRTGGSCEWVASSGVEYNTYKGFLQSGNLAFRGSEVNIYVEVGTEVWMMDFENGNSYVICTSEVGDSAEDIYSINEGIIKDALAKEGLKYESAEFATRLLKQKTA